MLFDKFEDTIFYKESTDLQNRYDALVKLSMEFPDNDFIAEELFLVSKGLAGEKEIKYQLSKCNLGLYVLQDVSFEYDFLTAQVDFIVITKYGCYFIECKNLIGNILVNEKGDFIREYTYKGRKIKKGLESPYRQVNAQLDVYRKIWKNRNGYSVITNLVRSISDQFYSDHSVLVVAANNETILNTRYAPKEMKNRIIKSDALVEWLKNDLALKEKNKHDKYSRKFMENWAKIIMDRSIKVDKDYYQEYKNKFIGQNFDKTIKIKPVIISSLKDKLKEFRFSRAKELNMPAYYIFNDEELDKIVQIHPISIDELSNILPSIKVKVHGSKIIDIINENDKNS